MRCVPLLVVLASCGRVGFERIGFVPDAAVADAVPDAAPDAAAKVCSAAYQPVSGLPSRYRAGGAPSSWQLAEENCELDGGHLVAINSDVEQAWVASSFAGVQGWIGLSDHQTEGVFLHVTGDPPTYSNWGAGEPNNVASIEDCVELYLDGSWNDQACSTAKVYVCECDDVPLPSPPVWCTTGIDASCDACGDVCTGGTTCSSTQTCL